VDSDNISISVDISQLTVKCCKILATASRHSTVSLVFTVLTYEGIARLHWTGWLVIYWDGLLTHWQSPISVVSQRASKAIK